jgi:hypothetical protein
MLLETFGYDNPQPADFRGGWVSPPGAVLVR